MDFVPFTIFFTVCLMVLHGNLASPLGCREPREWPESCANQAYCFDRPTNYPSTLKLKEMLDNSGFNVSKLETPKPIDRTGPCRYYHMIDPIYMIKDANNSVRYVVQDPNLLMQIVPLLPCKEQVDHQTTCKEDLGPWEFLVITCDGKRVEKINYMVPTGCSLREVDEYDYNY